MLLVFRELPFLSYNLNPGQTGIMVNTLLTQLSGKQRQEDHKFEPARAT